MGSDVNHNNIVGADWERDKFEYQMAQEMIRHYDSLNWQIGSILIAGSMVLTALAFNKDTIALLHQTFWPAIAVLLLAPCITLWVLVCWALWFRRHRFLYNLRNEVFHRIELKHHMFHYLRVVEADLVEKKKGVDGGEEENQNNLVRINSAKKCAGYCEGGFEPIYKIDHDGLPKPKGHKLVWWLAFGIPSFQLVGIAILVLCHHFKLP